MPSTLSPIQRILILHLGLYEACCNGASLGEGASAEEIAEQILYYHQEESTGSEHNVVSNQQEEAVQFLGLCTALYLLPSSLELGKNDSEREDETPFDEGGSNQSNSRKETTQTTAIYLEQSTLVFVPLEVSTNNNNTILAVVQVARSRCNPYAIRISIERCHRLFCTLNGGSIQQRLRACRKINEGGDRSKEVNNQGTTYWGMDKLFALLKAKRKQRERIQRNNSQNTDDEIQESNAQIESLQAEIRSLRRKLPIQAIRRDLDEHYKEYLIDFSVAISQEAGAGRCLVEAMPIPIAQGSASHVLQLPPSFVPLNAVESLKRSTDQILKAHAVKTDDGAGLLGIYTFHTGQLLHAAASPSKIVNNEAANLLMAYMASYKTKMLHHAAATNVISIRSMAGTLNNNDAVDVNAPSASSQNDNSVNRRGNFLEAPPSFMLSAGHERLSIEIGSGGTKQHVWTPRVTLDKASASAHMVMFDFLQFSFLIFLNLNSEEKRESDRLLLMKLEEELTEAVLLSEDSNKGGSTTTKWTNSPGQEIILLDRAQHRLFLLQDPSTPLSRRDTKKTTLYEKHKQKGFFGFRSKGKDQTKRSSQTRSNTTLTEWVALGLDCRHFLCSRLPLDVCLAFDDMINEMAFKSGLENAGEMMELCTCMPHGWMYAFKKGNKEVYAFFDGSIYVTVADVTSAAKRIQETFLASP